MTKSPKYRQSEKSGSRVPPLKKAEPRRDASATVPAPTGRNISAQGKEHSDASLGKSPKNPKSPVGAKQAGELPPGWKTVKFGDVCKIQGGYAFKSTEYQPTGIPLLRISNLVNGTVSFDENTVHLSENKLKENSDFILQKGDTLIAMSGATTGKMATFELEIPALLNQRVGRFRILSESQCTTRFISLLVSQITKKVLKEAYGAAQPNISPTQIEQMEVPLPPLPEQHRIVAEIEKQFTRLDAGVAALRRVQANLKRYRAAVLKAACEGRLVPTEVEMARATPVGPVPSPGVSPTVGRVPSHGVPMPTADAGSGDPAYRVGDLRAVGPVPSPGVPGKSKTAALGAATAKRSATFETGEALLARILTDRRQNWQGRGKYEEPAAPNAASLPALPDGWTWARLEQLGLTFGGLTKNPKRAKFPKQLPYLRVANVYANELRLDEIEYIGVEDSELQKLLVRAGDLLIVEGNGSKDQIGRAAIWDGSIDPCVHQNHLIKVRCINSQMPKWVLHWMQSPNGRHYVELVASSTSGLYTLSVNKVGDLPVALPPLAEQTRIVAEVERRLSVVDELEAAVSANLQRTNRLRQSILKKAFTGGLATDVGLG